MIIEIFLDFGNIYKYISHKKLFVHNIFFKFFICFFWISFGTFYNFSRLLSLLSSTKKSLNRKVRNCIKGLCRGPYLLVLLNHFCVQR